MSPLIIVSHHFMSRAEVETPLGQAPLALGVFHLPIDGGLVPMCEVNTAGIRERFYIRAACEPISGSQDGMTTSRDR